MAYEMNGKKYVFNFFDLYFTITEVENPKNRCKFSWVQYGKLPFNKVVEDFIRTVEFQNEIKKESQ